MTKNPLDSNKVQFRLRVSLIKTSSILIEYGVKPPPLYICPFFSSTNGQFLKPENLETKSVNVRHCHMAIFDKSGYFGKFISRKNLINFKLKKPAKIEGKPANNKFWEQIKNIHEL